MSGGETVHATCVAIGGRAVLITGPSGSGKSDLALRLIDRGALLVSDDYTLIVRDGERLIASAPATIAGRIEMRGVGIVGREQAADVRVCLIAEAGAPVERMPEAARRSLLGVDLPWIAIAALEASAPLKLESALQRFGLAIS